VAGASIMDVICCHNVEQEVSLGSSFKMLIFGREEVYNVSSKMF